MTASASRCAKGDKKYRLAVWEKRISNGAVKPPPTTRSVSRKSSKSRRACIAPSIVVFQNTFRLSVSFTCVRYNRRTVVVLRNGQSPLFHQLPIQAIHKLCHRTCYRILLHWQSSSLQRPQQHVEAGHERRQKVCADENACSVCDMYHFLLYILQNRVGLWVRRWSDFVSFP